MSFFGFIEKLRKKPEQDRRAISLVGASVMFGLVFFVWLTTFQLGSEKVKNEEVYDELSPVSSLKSMSSRFFDDIKEGLGSNEDDLTELQTETAATYTAAIDISDENMMGTTSDEIQFGTSSVSVDINNLEDNVFVGEITEKIEEDTILTTDGNEE